VTYSLLERRWKWNVDLVNIQDVTDNVLQLITSKMSNLEQVDKEILKVASCFGIKVKAAIVKVLSESSRFSGFALTRAVEQGFMERNGNNYKLVHDKVRGAARTQSSQ
jgi:predicted ATPase